jgi:hypothetical protein
MLGRRKALVTSIALVAASLVLSSCGGAAKTKQAATQTTKTTQTTQTTIGPDLSVSGVEKCLAAAGYEVVTSGDLPMIQRSKSVGVRLPGGGKVMPGNLSAAVFWYATAAKAESMQKSVQFRFKAILRANRIAAAFDPAPSGDTQTKFLHCISG